MAVLKTLSYLLLITLIQFVVSCTSSRISTHESQPKTSSADDSGISERSKPEEDADPDALRFFMDGQLYMSQGDYARAAIEFQDALSIDAEVSTIHVSLAECYWRLGKARRSFSHLIRALNIDPNDIEANQMLAHQFIVMQKFDKAEEQYQKLADLDPDNLEYILALADLAKIQRKYDQAIDIYTKAFELAPTAIKALENAIEIALTTKQFDKAYSIYKQLIKTDDSNIQYWQVYSDLAALNGDINESIRALSRIMEINGPDLKLLNRIGAMYIESDMPDSALLVLFNALALDSLNDTTLHFLSSTYRDLEQYDQAELYAQQLITHFPNDPQGYIDLVLPSIDQDNNHRAVSLLIGPAEQFMDNYAIQYLLGISYNLINDRENAEKYLERAVNIRPTAQNAWHALAIIYDTSQRWKESDSIYERLIEIDSVDAQAFNNYAYSLSERGERLEQALSMAKKAISIVPDNAAYLDTVGWIYYKLGKMDKAHNFIRRSIEIDDSNVVVLEHLGDVLMKMKHYDDARKYYQEALNLDNNNERLKSKIANN